MAAAISSNPAPIKSVTISSIDCPGNSSASACSLAASSSAKRTEYSFAVLRGAAVFFHRSSKGLNFTTTPPYRTKATGYYRPRGHSISAQSKSRPINLPSSGNSPHLGTAQSPDGAGAAGSSWRRNLAGVFEYSSRALALVWSTNKALSITLAVLTLIAVVLPAGRAFLGAQNVHAPVRASGLCPRTGTPHRADVGVLCVVWGGGEECGREGEFQGDGLGGLRGGGTEQRIKIYLEAVRGEEDSAKKGKLFDVGQRFLERYGEFFPRLYREDRDLTLRR